MLSVAAARLSSNAVTLLYRQGQEADFLPICLLSMRYVQLWNTFISSFARIFHARLPWWTRWRTHAMAEREPAREVNVVETSCGRITIQT